MPDNQIESQGWRLFDREERNYEGYNLFFERWVHDESRSGIVFFSYIGAGKVKFVVEGYGIGTINTNDFTELEDIAPIQRTEHENYDEARNTLKRLMDDNYKTRLAHRKEGDQE